MAKGSALKWLIATAGGAVVGALAIRALDRYVLAKEKKDVKELEAAEEQQQPQQPQLAPAGAPMVMPVMIPFPTPFAAMPPPQPQVPQLTPPTPIDTTAREPEEEEEDLVASIEEEWEREGYG